MSQGQRFKKIMASRAAAAVGWPVAVLLLGVFAAPYAAPTLAVLVRPATAALLGAVFTVLLFRTFLSARR